MDERLVDPRDKLVMKLLHFFITQEGYNPIILHGSENEIWLENLDASYKIVRIMTGHIHNYEQLNFDLFKTKTIMGRIKRKTFSFKMNVLSIFVDVEEDIKIESQANIDCVNLNDEKNLSEYDNVTKAFPSILKKLKFNEDGIKLFTKITNDINQSNKIAADKTETTFKAKTPYITYGLMALNLIVFACMYLFGKGSSDNNTLVNFGALVSEYVKAGDYYRLITATFLHIGVIHLAFNMYALYILGPQIESYFGHFKYLAIYLFSALLGSLLSIILTPGVISAGASGAIFGLLGSMLYFGYHYRVYLGNVLKTQIIPLIIINLAIGFLMPGIDQFAHLGGLVGGYLMANAVGVKNKSTKVDIINGSIVCALALIFLIYIAFIYTK
ncbi:MAG: rhomboid family intramembrane serine protease [Bacilli bacterium]|nr:rhomboid family intramembrane serine protease [Bacilli bacterium]